MRYFDLEVKVLQRYVYAENEVEAYEKLIKHLFHYVQFRFKSPYGPTLFASVEDMANPDFE